jgi:peptidoglycan/LPS O-acetylase OafA/YrhL
VVPRAFVPDVDSMPPLALTTCVRDEAPRPPARRIELDGSDPTSRRIGALDGLRGLAVALVVAYHLPLTVSVVPGGTLGVDIFFVLSGFLVTSLLLRRSTSGRMGRSAWAELRGFWIRRVVRLGPALLVLLVAWSLLWALTGGGGVFNTSVGHPAGAPSVPTWVNLRGLLAVALYGYNLMAAIDAPLPLAFGHLWSLSVEEQFYLVWPVVVLLMLRRARLRTMLGVTASLIVLSAIVSALQSTAHTYAWAYYGTESRAQQLLLGALLAMCWVDGLLRVPRRLATAVGLAGLAVLGVASRILHEHSWFGAHGGMLMTAAAAAAIIVCVICDGGGPATWIGWRPLRWLGRRSYAIYLWSFPLTMWSAGLSPGVQAAAVVSLAVTLAELSWRFVEEPAQRWWRMRAARAAGTREQWRGRRRELSSSANPSAE